jgi:hypothetical protein
MRIRQVRPEFWSDETMAALPPAVRLFYIGLWNMADDAGWIEWRVPRIGAVLFPYESVRRRTRDIESWSAALSDAGRLVLYGCGCAQVPTLSRHQRVTGKQSFTALDAHKKHPSLIGKQPPLTDSPVTLGNVTERNVLTTQELHDLRDSEDEVDREKVRAHRRLAGHTA